MLKVDRFPLASFPTPLESLDRLSAHLGGPRLWMKRDDLMGLGLGGNKVRKLELLLEEARKQGCDTLLTVGARQSNHVRLTGAAARRAGMRCEALLFEDTEVREGGNLLLNELLGIRLHLLPVPIGACTPERLSEAVESTRAGIRRRGGRPYYIPAGGAGDPGQIGYVLAVEELREQASAAGVAIGHLVTAVGTGGTLAGLVLGVGLLGCPWKVWGVSAAPPGMPEALGIPSAEDLVRSGAAWLGRTVDLPSGSLQIDFDFVGKGYGVPTAGSREAIRLLAELEGIFLDPVYTCKAMAWLLSRIREGGFDREDNVVFLHTGGTPALFAASGGEGKEGVPSGG